jgi:hypothetical protein
MVSISESTALNVSAKAVLKKEICRRHDTTSYVQQFRNEWNQETSIIQEIVQLENEFEPMKDRRNEN